MYFFIFNTLSVFITPALINAGPFYAGPNSATPKIWLNAT